MKRLFLIATFALAALTAYAQQKDPLYIINECVVSASEVQELTSQGHIDVLTVVRDANELKEYERFGDTSNGVILGFGYDPIFYYPPAGMTTAEMSSEAKHAISHRGNALKVFYNKLKEAGYADK